MSKNKMALGPFLEKIENLCAPLDREQLLGIIIDLAKEFPTSERRDFLAYFRELVPVGAAAGSDGPGRPGRVDDETLAAIEELRQSILERAAAIDDGSYWDDPEIFEDHDDYRDYYNHDGPDYLSEDHCYELKEHFAAADALFLHGNLSEAQKIYAAVLAIIDEVQHDFGPTPELNVDLGEARARFCRCVYEATPPASRVSAMLQAMAVDEKRGPYERDISADYPLLRDVLEARPEPLPEFSTFLPAWEQALTGGQSHQQRRARLLTEAVGMGGKPEKLARLARQWGKKQPLGYLAWLDHLARQADWRSLAEVAEEALQVLAPGAARVKVAHYLVMAGEKTGDDELVLTGRRERFHSRRDASNLATLAREAERQGRRRDELAALLLRWPGKKKLPLAERGLAVKAMLMAGELEPAFALVKDAKGVGWSEDNGVGLFFAATLKLASGHHPDCNVLEELFTRKAQDFFALSWLHPELFNAESYGGPEEEEEEVMNDRGQDNDDQVPAEIRRGLELAVASGVNLEEYRSWAQKIGEQRVNSIVSNKHRNAYDRAASVLTALAETLAATGAKPQAGALLADYYHRRFNRFAAFRSELRTTVASSQILQKSRVTLSR